MAYAKSRIIPNGCGVLQRDMLTATLEAKALNNPTEKFGIVLSGFICKTKESKENKCA